MASACEEAPVRSMILGWFLIMGSACIMAWIYSNQWTTVIIAALVPPALAILEGTISILRYRICFGDAPRPLSPAHGVVVVHPDDRQDIDIATSSCMRNASTGCNCMGGRRWRGFEPPLETTREWSILQKAWEEPPLRLLVIGDSLAVGVGTSGSCTPILPEIIARTLSKAMGGRAVYWSCHGEPGASTGWIARELELEQDIAAKAQQNSNLEETLYETDSSSSSDEPFFNGEAQYTDSDFEEDVEEPFEYREWRKRLHRHKKRFHRDEMGPYDIAVVLTGPNDLKSSFFPFLLTGEAVEFRKQARERGGSFANELGRVLDVLSRRMKLRLQKRFDQLQKSVEAALPDQVLERIHAKSKPMDAHIEDDIELNASDPLVKEESSFRRPMVVLPGMPARALPIFRIVPLRWLAIPIVAIMDNHKRNLAKFFPDEVLFVEAPTVSAIADFEAQTGPVWEQRCAEDTLLALRDVTPGACAVIETQMKEYYRCKDPKEKCDDSGEEADTAVIPQHNPPVPSLAERPGPPGSKIFGVDNVHPNDEGYDFWGRHIADAIVKEWKR